MAASPPPPAGWYPDPTAPGQRRWWNGTAWSGQTAPLPRVPGAQPHTLVHAESPAAGNAPTYGLVPAGPTPAYRPLVPGAVTPLGSGYTPPPIGSWRSPADTRPLVRGMGEAIRAVFTRYASFEGRATRSEYWYFTLFSFLITIGSLFLIIVPILGVLAGVIYFAWGLGALLPTLAVSVRRLRDAGLHWGWIFLSLAPFGIIALIVMWCQPSKYP